MTTQAKPKFITFTGADDYTPIAGMIELSMLYPIEWGILFSPKRQGEGRYPSMPFIERLVGEYSLEFSAHLCGGDSRTVVETGNSQHDALIKSYFLRAQINTTANPDPLEIRKWARSLDITPILQCRSMFPDHDAVEWLFDASGGRGIAPAAWPKPWPNVLSGYAGGLNPLNVANAVSTIGQMTDNYWIDMETGVRDANDRFDLSLCRQVCEAVYG